MFIYIKK